MVKGTPHLRLYKTDLKHILATWNVKVCLLLVSKAKSGQKFTRCGTQTPLHLNVTCLLFSISEIVGQVCVLASFH